MEPALYALIIAALASFAVLIPGLKGKTAGKISFLAILASSIICSIPVVETLFTGAGDLSFNAEWSLPFAKFAIGLDPLSAFFLIPILIVFPLSALYGTSYLEKKESGFHLSFHWFNFCILFASMILLAVSRNVILFLVAWEIMSLSSFFLVMFDGNEKKVRSAGWSYIVATQAGALFIIAGFAVLSSGCASLDFKDIATHDLSRLSSAFIFIVSFIGFGAKAGFIPLHFWLPEAHPAAPSHISAVMSGIMIKMGIYGIIRIILLIGGMEEWWGWLFVVIGAATGILGIIYAMAQHEIKRLLAYSSIENIGIICLGIGTGIIGAASGNTFVAAMGFGGGLLHVLNHAIFKSLLFMSAGSIIKSTGTGEIDKLGGLMKKMPKTGAGFITGATAISGLPPFNGFVSEFMIYAGAFYGIMGASGPSALPFLAVILSLSIIGGLALACFAKVSGIIFLGEARSEKALSAMENSGRMTSPMIILSILCAFIGISSFAISGPLCTTVISIFPPLGLKMIISSESEKAYLILNYVTFANAVLLWFAGLVFLAYGILTRKSRIRTDLTWDCGYAAPSAKMQYTSSSFIQPLTDVFGIFIRTKEKSLRPTGIFPGKSFFHSEAPDFWIRFLFAPLLVNLSIILRKIRRLEKNGIHVSILYTVITLITLLFVTLIWKLKF